MHTSQGKGSNRKATLVLLLSFVVMGVASVAVKAACHPQGRLRATLVLLLSLGVFGGASGVAVQAAWQRRHEAARPPPGSGDAAPPARRDAHTPAGTAPGAPLSLLSSQPFPSPGGPAVAPPAPATRRVRAYAWQAPLAPVTNAIGRHRRDGREDADTSQHR